MTYFVGIDWADARHDICIVNPDGRVVNEFAIAHSLKGFEEFQAVLTTLGEVEINIERPNGLLVDYLVAQSWSLHVTSPFLVAHRRAHTSKNDRGDALILAQLLRSGDRDCRRLAVSTPLTETLLHLVQQFDLLQRDRHRLANRLTHWLKLYYPAALDLFRHTYQPLTLAFLERFSDPQTARAASLEEFDAFFRSQRYRYRERIPLIYQTLQASAPFARETVGYVGGLKALLAVLTTLNAQLKALEKQINSVFHQHPEAAWWLRFPGCGPLTAARLLARIGDNRARFPTAGILQAVAGTVPITRRSG
jgi:transposase